ncbi:hypothetical protein DR84_2074 [Francisella tularensis]|nr:hypothetical protein DR84_2074 [Francisella tularensis]
MYFLEYQGLMLLFISNALAIWMIYQILSINVLSVKLDDSATTKLLALNYNLRFFYKNSIHETTCTLIYVKKTYSARNSVIPSSCLLITMSLKSWLYDGIFIRHYNISTNIFFYKYLSD